MKQFCFAIVLVGVLGGCAGAEVPSGGGPGAGGNAGQAGASSGAGGVSVGGMVGSMPLAGMGGALGGAGMSGGGGAGGGGVGGVGGDGPDTSMKPSTGCTKPANQALEEWVKHTVMAQDPESMALLNREYFVRLPANYNPANPYRLMFVFPGCGGKGDGAVPLFNAPGADAIVVGGSPAPGENCMVYEANSKDVMFFDAMLKVVQESFCVDQNRMFTSGFSSGSWFSNVLGCQRSNILRAQGNISGCWPDDGRLDPAVEAGMPSTVCEKRNIAGIFIHDASDGTNTLECGIMARNRLLLHNGCTMETRPVEPDPCVEYQGCKSGYPVIWCQTDGTGHSRQDGLTIPAIYNFFAQF
ncbi:MAG TPA: hypothetical protein VJN18_25395 [Polyangiaceae bacterium]|nr:hypothetical protein [Polyangiaceae bacterium]